MAEPERIAYAKSIITNKIIAHAKNIWEPARIAYAKNIATDTIFAHVIQVLFINMQNRQNALYKLNMQNRQ